MQSFLSREPAVRKFIVRNFTVRKLVLLCALSLFVCLCVAPPARGSTIIKLTLGETGPDVSMNDSGVFATTSDGIVATSGDQNSSIDFTGFLSALPDIPASTASFTVSNVQATGLAQVFGALVSQAFTGGSFSLYDSSNVLLLSGDFGDSDLTGTIGPPATGSVFTTTTMTATGGTLLSMLDANSLSMSFAFTDVNGGAGFGVSGNNALNPFLADAVVTIAANENQTPEPASLAVIALAGVALAARRK